MELTMCLWPTVISSMMECNPLWLMENPMHVFTEKGVQLIASYLDHQNKKTRFDDKASL